MTTATTPAEPTAVVRRETLNNIFIGIVISVFATWLVFRDQPSTPALAKIAGVFGIVVPTFNVAFLITLGMTLVVRLRVRAGRIRRALQNEGLALAGLLPRNVLLRALSLALAMLLAVVPATLLVVWSAIRSGILPEEWSLYGFMIFYIVYFTVLAAVITPVVIWRGVQD